MQRFILSNLVFYQVVKTEMVLSAGVNSLLSVLDTWTITIILLVFICLMTIISYARVPGKLPPGPRGAPIVGVMPFMGKKPYLQIQAWWRTYGDVYSMYMGSRLMVVINGIDAMKECFIRQGDTFSGRPWNYFKKLTRNKGQ